MAIRWMPRLCGRDWPWGGSTARRSARTRNTRPFPRADRPSAAAHRYAPRWRWTPRHTYRRRRRAHTRYGEHDAWLTPVVVDRPNIAGRASWDRSGWERIGPGRPFATVSPRTM